MNYVYKMVQVPPNVEASRGASRGQEAAWYLQEVANREAREGWEFYRVDTIGVVSKPGCLGSLLGAKAQMTDFYVVTFRKAALPA